MPTYNAPTGTYTSSIPSGVQAFRRAVAAHYGFTRTEVVRDKSRCAGQRSEHCECGAVDFFSTDPALARRVFEWSIRQGDTLGVQSSISFRRVWGFGEWRERAYTGPSPHTDHNHIGLNRWARANLTEAMVRATFGSGGGDTVGELGGTQLGDIQKDQLTAILGAAARVDADTDKLGPMHDRLVRLETKVDQLISSGTGSGGVSLTQLKQAVREVLNEDRPTP